MLDTRSATNPANLRCRVGTGQLQETIVETHTSTDALAYEHEGFIEVVVLAKLTGPNDCRLRWGGTASQVMCNLILSQSKPTEASALKKQNKESMYLPVTRSQPIVEIPLMDDEGKRN